MQALNERAERAAEEGHGFDWGTESEEEEEEEECSNGGISLLSSEGGADQTREVRTSSSSYSFDFGDIDERAVLEEGEMSPEEQQLQQMEALCASSTQVVGRGRKRRYSGSSLG